MTLAVVEDAGALAALDQAYLLLERAQTVDVAKDVRDKAEALRVYAAQAGRGLALQNACAELRLRAERRVGELIPDYISRNGRGTDTLSVLGIAHHQSSRWQRLARIPDADFEQFLTNCHEAATEITGTAALKLAKRVVAQAKPDTREHAPTADLAADEQPDEFACIVIDPPWRYDNVATRGAAEDHYPTMSLDELAALTIPAAANAHMYLWTTNSFLRPAFDLLDAWDFTYKTCLTWCKPQIGMGNYFRNSTEHVLFGVRGSLPTLANNVPTHFVANRTRHSAKPESFYDLVEKCSPGPWLEMFARRRRFGWAVWGNEA